MGNKKKAIWGVELQLRLEWLAVARQNGEMLLMWREKRGLWVVVFTIMRFVQY